MKLNLHVSSALTIALLVFLCLNSSAQLTSNFSANNTFGCSETGLNVSFTFTGTGTPTSYLWDFGNGNTSTIANPTEVFTTTGQYTISLHVEDGTNTDDMVISNLIEIQESPSANFTTNSSTSGCKNLSVAFIDQSTPGGAAIASWSWAFNDGSFGSSTQNPIHQFSLAGEFDVTLGVTDMNGCVGSYTIQDMVYAVNPPSLNFSLSTVFACDVPLTVDFNNTSSSSTFGDTLTYLWDLGDGSFSSLVEPQNIYTAFGSYDVALTISDPIGCEVSYDADNLLNILNLQAGINTSADTICPGEELEFDGWNATVGGLNFVWSFGDGDSAFQSIPIHSFDEPGTYTVTLVASNNGCSDTQTKSIVVEEVIADFSVTDNYSCNNGFTTGFINQSTNGSTYNWSFSNNVTSAAEDTLITFTLPSDTLSRWFSASLSVISSFGCTADTTKENIVEIHLLKPKIVSDISAGCIPLIVNFTDNSTPADSIVSWLWDLGDATTSTLQNPSNTYPVDGVYPIALTITNSNGCDTVAYYQIKSGFPQNADFSVVEDTICTNGPLMLTDISTDQNLVNQWIWTATNPAFAFTTDDQNPNYFGLKSNGYMGIRFMAGYNGCFDTLIVDSAVFVLGPVTDITDTSFLCSDPLIRTFQADFLDTTAYYWVFDDGDTLFSDGTANVPGGANGGRSSGLFASPTHAYDSAGNYVVKLVGIDSNAYFFSASGCQYITSFSTKVTQMSIALTSSTDTVCKLDTVYFDGFGSSNGISAAETYSLAFGWDFDDGDSTVNWHTGNDSLNLYDDAILLYPNSTGQYFYPKHIYDSIGTYTVNMRVQDNVYCTMDTSITVVVVEPSSTIGISDTIGCYPYSAVLYDLSSSPVPVSQWQWSINGQVSSDDSSFTNVLSTLGSNAVALTVTDPYGCATASSINVHSVAPSANFSIADSTLCAGVQVQFTDSSLGWSDSLLYAPVLQYTWSLGDGNFSNLQNPLISYIDTGFQTISLSVLDSLGCTNTKTVDSLICVQGIPVPNFTVSQQNFCIPDTVIFIDSSLSNYITSWTWDLGNSGLVIDSSSVQFLYTEPDTLDISLRVTTSYGCTDSITKIDFLIPYGPQATYTVSADSSCRYVDLMFAIDSLDNVSSWQWVFGDGETATSDSAYHSYNIFGPVTPSLSLYSAQGCEQNISLDTLYIHEIVATWVFETNDDADTIGCAPDHKVVFKNKTLDVWAQWDFGDGITDQGYHNVEHWYADPGEYELKLLITDTALGCIDSLTQTITVLPPLDPPLYTGDTVACQLAIFNLSVDSVDSMSYYWAPNSQIILGQSTPSATSALNLDEDYVLTATDTLGCTSTVNFHVSIFAPATVGHMISDTNLVIGESMQLDAQIPPGFIFEWSPKDNLLCDSCLVPLFVGYEDASYQLYVQDSALQCPAVYLDVNIAVLDTNSLSMATAFSPNGDGLNDLFGVRGWAVEKVVDFQIFNRWGELVFANSNEDANDDVNRWDGYYKGTLQEQDTYIYLVQVQFINGELSEAAKGYIHLVR